MPASTAVQVSKKRADAKFCSAKCKQSGFRHPGGIIFVTIPTDPEMREAMVEDRYLRQWDEKNPAAIAEAIGKVFEVLKRNVP